MTTSQITRDTVFPAGGQPDITYVERSELDIERALARAIAAPNQIVSLSGPTKAGKTVLCRRVLGQRDYVWIEGGQIRNANDIWDKICFELNYPVELNKSTSTSTTGGLSFGLDKIISANGSRLSVKETTRTYHIDSMASALRHMLDKNLNLVVDDFHYIEDEARKQFLRNVKGAIFNGLKIILLSVTHRAFDAIKAETELTGRFTSIDVPDWNVGDLMLIPKKGFTALNMQCPHRIIEKLASEAQGSPFLMQQFCWEICFDMNIDTLPPQLVSVPVDLDADSIFMRIAIDSGLPIYQRLVVGPQSRKIRLTRPLRTGGEADVYQAVLLAVAETGPQRTLSYDKLRASLNTILTDKVPQKHEITSALKHLSKISREIGTDTGLDWDDDNRELNIADPYLRFYLRWQVRMREHEANPLYGE